nr:exported hypothetical protein [Rhizobiaceae bacterium]
MAMTWIFTLAMPSSTSAAMPASIQASRVMRPVGCLEEPCFARRGFIALTCAPKADLLVTDLENDHVAEREADRKRRNDARRHRSPREPPAPAFERTEFRHAPATTRREQPTSLPHQRYVKVAVTERSGP